MELNPEDVNIVAHDIDHVRSLVKTFPYECVLSMSGVGQLFDSYRGHVDVRIEKSTEGTLTILFGLVKREGQTQVTIDSRGWVIGTKHHNMSAGVVIDIFTVLVTHLRA